MLGSLPKGDKMLKVSVRRHLVNVFDDPAR
jgi:hypothetical protein